MKRIALFFALAVAAIACTPEETVTPEIKVVPAESELLLPTEGGELTIKFNTNVDWTASVKEADAKEWCSLSPATGKPGDNTLKVIALENEGTENRTVTVVITAMEATAEVVVTQLQKDALVLTGNKSFEVPYQGQNLEFAVSHNSELKAEADVEWITEVKAKAVEESKLTFAVAPNTGEARTGKITFTAGSLKEVVEVKQAAWALEFTVTPEDETKTFEAEGGEYEVTVAANVEYTVNVPENDWLTVADAEGVYTFTAAANTTPAAREVTVTIAPKDEKLAEAAVAIKMNQKGAGAKLVVSDEDKADKWLSPAASTFELTVDTNLEVEVTYGWDAEGVEPWISFTEADGVYTFAVAEGGWNLRSAFVYITPVDEAYADLAVIISVFQNGRAVLNWTAVPTKAYTEYTAGPVRLAMYGEYLLVSNTNKILAINPETGELVTTFALPEGFVCANLCVDEGGNIIVANEPAFSWSGTEYCEILTAYVIRSLESDPELLFTYHTGNIWGDTTGNLRVSGNIDTKALITASASGASYWIGWPAENGAVLKDDNGAHVWKANTTPYTFNSANYACVTPAGPELEDGLWFMGYSDGKEDLQFCSDPTTNTWISTGLRAYDGLTLNPSAIALAELNGRSYALVMSGAFFNYHDPQINFYDVTDKTAVQNIYNFDLGYYAERNDDWSLVNWTGAAIRSDVLAVPTAEGVKVFFIDANFNMIGCVTVQ